MIARDEEGCIADAISSVKDLVDEVIVVDTGSVDRTASRAASCGARVYAAAWSNDFSAARNWALSKAAREWILILDADEVIAREDHDRIRYLIASHPEGAFIFNQQTYTDDSSRFGWRRIEAESDICRGSTGYFSSHQVRLFRSDAFFRYRGGLHEDVEASLCASGVSMYVVDVTVHHYGRLCPTDRIHRKYLTYMAAGSQELDSKPRNASYIHEMAEHLLALGHLKDALAHIDRCLELDPRSWQFFNMRALALFASGRTGEALESFRMALELETGSPDIYNNYGAALLETGSVAQALDMLKRGLELDANHSSLLRNAASASLAFGRLEEAEYFITRSLEADPFIPQSHAIHAEILLRREDYAGSYDALCKVRFLPGTPLKVYLKAAHLFIQMKMVKEAEDIIRRAIEEYPAQGALVFLSGKILEMKGEDEGAAAIYQRLLAGDPHNADVLNSLGCIHERRGVLEKALQCFRNAFRLAPENAQIEANLGIIETKLGSFEDAGRHLRHVVERDGDSGVAHNALGCLLAGQALYHEAVVHFRRAVELEPGNTSYHLNLGLVCERMQKPGEAAAIYEKMIRTDASVFPLVRDRLQKLHRVLRERSCTGPVPVPWSPLTQPGSNR